MQDNDAAATYEVEAASAHVESLTEITEAVDRHIVLLHGWNSGLDAMLRWQNAIRAQPEASHWNIWRASYESNWQSFVQSARDVASQLRAKGADFSNTILVGYSTGGVVARRMVADGFPCRALISICAPHEGLGAWVPTPNPTSMSVAPWSADLANLNRDPNDTRARGKYHFFGVTYEDVRGFLDDDAVVPRTSAWGASLGNVAQRERVHLKYSGGFAGGDPHMRGMDPDYMGPVLSALRRLLRLQVLA